MGLLYGVGDGGRGLAFVFLVITMLSISRFRRAARTPVATVTAWVRVARARFWSAGAYAYLHALNRCSFLHVLILHAGCKHTSL